MPEDCNSYFCNVNGVLASILLDLELRKRVPDRSKPNLLWVWVYMKSPRQDGLSDTSEFEMSSAIEDELAKAMAKRFRAVFCGRITTNGRREFYYYAPQSGQLEASVEHALSGFRGYEFDCGCKVDPEWRQYLNVLYPSDEDRQRIENRKLLDVLEQKGDRLKMSGIGFSFAPSPIGRISGERHRGWNIESSPSHQATVTIFHLAFVSLGFNPLIGPRSMLLRLAESIAGTMTAGRRK